MISAIRDRAGNKAFAKIATLTFEIAQLKKDIHNENNGEITMEELKLIYEGSKTELKVWNLIAELVEKSDI